MRILLRVIIAALAAAGCLPGVTGPNLVGEGRPVLFIGNSYTYVNDLPGMVQALADSAGGEKLAVETVAEPDFALVDHWARGTAQREIAKGGWAFVVLQQGPSSVGVNRDTLRLATKLFAPGIAAAGAKPALFSAWPTVDRRVDYPRAIESYRIAAADVDGVFLPVAAAWLAVWEKDPTLQLYAPDGLHASPLGSYVAALVIYSKLLNKTPIGLPATIRIRSGGVLTIDPTVARKVQEAAQQVVSAP